MTERSWQNGAPGGTPLSAEWMNGIERDLDARALVWLPNTQYAAGTRVVSPQGDVVTAKADHKSGAAYLAEQWSLSTSYVRPDVLGQQGGVATLGQDGKLTPGQLPPLGSLSRVGTFAARPAANTVTAGVTYFATDTQEQYRSDGAAWQVVGPGGNDLGSTSMEVWFLTTSQTSVDVTGMTVTFVAGHRPVKIRFDGDLSSSVGNIGACATILLDGAAKAEINAFFPYADKWETRAREVRVPGLVPGSTHTAKLVFKAVGAGTARIDGNATKPSTLTVTGC